MKYYTNGHGDIYTGNQFKKEIWNWFKWIKINSISWLYTMLKNEYMKTYGFTEIKLTNVEYAKLKNNDKRIQQRCLEMGD